MLDSPITLLLLGISAASAIASYSAARRRRRSRAQPSALPALSHLSDEDLLAALAALQPGTDHRGINTSAEFAPHRHTERAASQPVSAMRSASKIREHATQYP
jgi:hypothetical protein